MPYTRGRTARVIPITRRRRGMGQVCDAGYDESGNCLDGSAPVTGAPITPPSSGCTIDALTGLCQPGTSPVSNPTTPAAPTTGIGGDITSILNTLIGTAGAVSKAVVTTPTYTYTANPNGTVTVTSTGGATPTASVLGASTGIGGLSMGTLLLIGLGLGLLVIVPTMEHH